MRTAQLDPVTTADRRGDAREGRGGPATADGSAAATGSAAKAGHVPGAGTPRQAAGPAPAAGTRRPATSHAPADGTTAAIETTPATAPTLSARAGANDRIARPAEPLPDGHPLLTLAAFGLGDVRLVPVVGQPVGVTSVVALIGDPLSSIAPLVRLHRGRARPVTPGADIASTRFAGTQGGGARPLGRSGNTGADDLQLVRAFRRLREDGAGILVYHRVDGDPSHPDPRDRALGVPDRSPGLDALAATVASLGLRPVRILVPAAPDPDALDPRDLGLPVIRTTTFGPGGGPLRPRALVW